MLGLLVKDHDIVGKSVIKHEPGTFLQHIGVDAGGAEQFYPVGEDFTAAMCYGVNLARIFNLLM